jgi:hypothetical protein
MKDAVGKQAVNRTFYAGNIAGQFPSAFARSTKHQHSKGGTSHIADQSP